MATRAYIGLGANIGDPRATLERAVASLGALPGARLASVSPLYRTKPVGVLDQPDFLNAVVALDLPAVTDPTTGALDLLVVLKRLERESGRRPGRRWGPRELDLDLLLYGDHGILAARPAGAAASTAATDALAATDAITTTDALPGPLLLEVPHRSVRDRLFVLAPLADLAPDLVPPGWRETVAAARDRLEAMSDTDAVARLGDWESSARAWRIGGAGEPPT